LNGASIYIESLRNPDKYKTDKGEQIKGDILHAGNPAGPKGQFHYHASFHHGIMNYSKNQKLAKEFIKWLHAKEHFEPWFVSEKGFSVGSTKMWEEHAMWKEDPVMLPYRTAARAFQLFGFAGPPSAKASEAYSKYIVVDMYAKAIQGMSAEDAAKWAEGELKRIYG
jgi:multiple sugar transport system substrate-binding protein